MRFIVFSFLFMTQVFCQDLSERFSSEACLKGSFNTSIEHDAYLFGLVKAKFDLKKDKCIIHVQYKELLEKSWTVDLCREPIHIKHKDKGTLTVFKKIKNCDKSADKFCQSYRELIKVIQDYGLIFASGAREKLEESHGKVFCSYLLMKKYLEEGAIFSLYSEAPDLYGAKKESCAIEKANPQQVVIEDKENLVQEIPKLKYIEGKKEDKPQF